MTTARLGRGSFAFIVQGCREPRLDRCIDLRLFCFCTEIGNPCRTERTPEVEAEATMAGKKKAKSTVKSQKWEHIHFVGRVALEWPRPLAYRFVPFCRVKQMFKDNKITFISPEKWTDPYEKKYLNVRVNGKNVLPNIACLCFKTSLNDNSAAFWESKRKDGEPVIRLTFDLCELWNVLNEFAEENNGVEIYVSLANYVSIQTINHAYQDSSIMKSDLRESYIRLMSLKRAAYKYEDELRIFITWEKNDKNKVFDEFKKKKILRIDLNESQIIKKILLDPVLPKIETAIQLNLLEKKDVKKFREIEKNFMENKIFKGIEIRKSSFAKCKEGPKSIEYPLLLKENVEKDKIAVAVINWDMTDEMNEDNASLYIADAFSEYQKNPVTWNRNPKFFYHSEERRRQRELKSRVAKVNHVWIVGYNTNASIPLDGLDSDYYEIKRIGDDDINLIKSKEKIPFSTLCLDSGKLPNSVEDDAITFILLEDLMEE